MGEREWQIRSNSNPPADLLNFVNQDSTIAGYLMQRGITTADQAVCYLEPDRDNLTDPNEMPDMDIAVERIIKAIHTHELIGIWGDFDVDGQTATAVLVECFTKLGANVQYYLPVRGKESHGISIPSLQKFLQKGISLLITCDTGISEHEAVIYSVENLVDVIITDHHTLPETLPSALACINPRCLPEGHPLGFLSGSAAAFELMLAVCRKLGREEIAFESIDLAAIGLIADLAPLIKDSRLVAQLGLMRLNNQPRLCFKSLLEAAGMPARYVDEQTIGFILAPRLNAAGRLEDANPLVGFLMDREPDTIPDTAARLEAMNANRKWLCDQVYQSAIDQVTRQKELADSPIIVLSHPTWPGGVLGLVAGRLAAEFNRPAIILNDSTDGLLRGSARSVEGLNITEAITSTEHLLRSFGGHPMAAGLSLPADNLFEFRRSINNWVLDHGFTISVPPVIEIDAELALPKITHEFYSSLKKLSPFGNSNPPLVFCSRSVQITATKSLGRTREHFKFTIQDEKGFSLPLVWWNAEEDQIPAGRFDIAFSLNENEYRGEVTLQAEWIDHHRVKEAEVSTISTGKVQILDFRTSSEPVLAAIRACDNKTYLVYQEPPVLENPESIGRNHLYAVDALIMASIPPSRQVFEHIIKDCQPRQVVLAFENPGALSPQLFLKQLSGLIRYAVLERKGLASLSDLAEATNMSIETVQTGIQWLKASGKIDIISTDRDLCEFLIKNLEVDQKLQKETEILLRFLLKETESFFQYFASLPIEACYSLLASIAPRKS